MPPGDTAATAASTAISIQKLHMFIKLANFNESCKKSAANVVCKGLLQPCTKDMKKIVSFINKEQCLNGLNW